MTLHTIDPHLWERQDFAALSPQAKLLYLGLVSIVDDQGRMRFAHNIVVGSLYLYDDPSRETLKQWLQELIDNRFIRHYKINGAEYVQIEDWWDSQVNNRAEASKFPAPPNWQDKHGYVYLIFDGSLYKIGISAQPEKRLQQIRWQNGRDCSVLVLIESPEYKTLESELHEKFSNKRVKGEWFKLDPDDIAWIMALAIKKD